MTDKHLEPTKGATTTPMPGQPSLMLGAYDVASLGYTTEEFFISGEATSYESKTQLKPDGLWTAEPAAQAPYTSRIVVLRPTDSAKFNGTVLVEWLNVSGGLDAPADWFMAHREIVRGGYAYVAVSAQKVGIEGGPSMGMDMSLKKMAPERYESLSHPGDAFAFDIFSQAGRLVRAARPGGILGPLSAERVLATGESQSAHFLTTYVNAIDPLAKIYDGFLIHSRFAGAAPLDGASIMSGGSSENMPGSVRFRHDLRVPVITIITETDLIGLAQISFFYARQEDGPRLRTWEIPGTAHADIYTVKVAQIDTGATPVEQIAAAYAPTCELMGTTLEKPINCAPQHHYIVEAALHALNQWVRTGAPAPVAPRITLTESEPPQLVLDANGMALGGIRSPWVDVPTALMSGVGNGGGMMAALFGMTEPFDAATLARLYPDGKAQYVKRFEDSLNASIDAGFILPADRGEIMELAGAMFPSTTSQSL